MSIHDFFFISTSNFESRLDGAYDKTDFVEIFTLILPVIVFEMLLVESRTLRHK